MPQVHGILPAYVRTHDGSMNELGAPGKHRPEGGR
jgi:hypothetical protein